MPWRKYTNAEDAELVACLESIQRRSTTGEVQFVTLPGGGQMQRTFQNGNHVDKEVRYLQYEAFCRGMVGYSNPYAQRIRRTMASYS